MPVAPGPGIPENVNVAASYWSPAGRAPDTRSMWYGAPDPPVAASVVVGYVAPIWPSGSVVEVSDGEVASSYSSPVPPVIQPWPNPPTMSTVSFRRRTATAWRRLVSSPPAGTKALVVGRY